MKILHHPGVINFIEQFETKNHLYIVEEIFYSEELLTYI